MKDSFFQLSKLKQVTDPKTKVKTFSGEISIVYVRTTFIQVVGTDIVNNRTISWIVCNDGSHYPVDIHPSDLIEAMQCNLITTASIMSAKNQLTPDKNFG